MLLNSKRFRISTIKFTYVGLFTLDIIYVWPLEDGSVDLTLEAQLEMGLILTDVSGIQRLSVSDLGEKFTIPIQLSRVRITQATMVTSGCKAT